MYLVNTRPGFYFSFNTLIQYMVGPMNVHWVVVKHVLRYLHGIVDYGLDHRRGDGASLTCYTDLDWEGSVVDRKSTLGYCLSLVLVVVSCFSRKQKSVTLSSTREKYMEASKAC